MGEWSQLEPFQLKNLVEVVTKMQKGSFRGAELFPNEKDVRGNKATWDEQTNTQRTGSLNVYGGASLPTAQLARAQRTVQMLYFSESITFDVGDMMGRALGTQDIPWIAKKVGEDLNVPMTRLEYLMEWARWQVLTTGALSYAGGTAGAPIVSIDYGVDATHLPTAANLWSDTTNATPWTDLSTARRLVRHDSNLDVTKALMNATTMEALVKCVIAKGAQLDELVVQEARRDNVISRLGGLDLDVYDATYHDGTSVTEFIPDGKVVLAAPEALRWYVGSQPVPANPAAGNTDFVEQTGISGWAVASKDPVSMKLIVSNVFLPVVVESNGLVCYTVL